jgi:hypothetical protein
MEGPGNKTIGNPSAVSLKQEFLNPFDEAEVLRQFNSKSESLNPEEPSEIFSQKIGNFDYSVLEKKNMFEVHFELTSDKTKAPDSQIIIRRLDSKKEGTGYNIIHRIVRTQKDGVGGTSFLKKAEEYIAILRKNKLIDCNWLGLESGQPDVTDFFIKNGYGVIQEMSEPYLKYLENKDQYENIIFDPQDNTLNLEDRSPLPVAKEAFNDPEFLKFLKEENGKKIFSCGFEESKTFSKYFPYVVLVKKFEN